MAEAGHFVATCYSAEEAIDVIEKYLNLKKITTSTRASENETSVMMTGQTMKIPNNSILKDGKIKGGRS